MDSKNINYFKLICNSLLLVLIAIMFICLFISCQFSQIEVAYAAEADHYNISVPSYNGITFEDLSVPLDTDIFVSMAYGSGYSESYYMAIAIEMSGAGVFDLVSYQDGSRLRIYCKGGSISYSTTCYAYDTQNCVWNISDSRCTSGIIESGSYADIFESDSNSSFKLKNTTADIDRQVNGQSLGVFEKNLTGPWEPHIHDYVSEQTINPTCIMSGYTNYVCSCGESYQGNYIPALGHDYLEEEVLNDSGELEYTLISCSRCSYTDKKYPPAPPVQVVAESVGDVSTGLFSVAGDAMTFIVDHPIVLIATLLFVIFAAFGIVTNFTKGVGR